jgi:DNA polymerase II large subunit
LDRELAFQTEHFLKEYSVKEYITQKPMIVEYRGGELAKDLFSKKQTKIDWF